MQPKAIVPSKESKYGFYLTDISKIEWICDKEWMNWELNVLIDQSNYLIHLPVRPSIHPSINVSISYLSCLQFLPWILATLGDLEGRSDYNLIKLQTRRVTKEHPDSFNYYYNNFVFISNSLNCWLGEEEKPEACY